MLPEDSVPPSYSQLYIFDPHEAYRFRVIINEDLSLNTLRILQQLLLDHNRYAHIYQHSYEVLRSYDAPDFSVKLCVVPVHDPRCYNLPMADEVGVILPEGRDFEGDFRDIVLHLRPEYYRGTDESDNHQHLHLDRINEGHAAYSPLHYVLLFPYGEPGWYYEEQVPGHKRRVTLLQHSAYRFHSHPNEFSTIL